MPMSKYNKFFGGKKGSAAKAKKAMAEEYGEEKGEKVFYALKNKRKGKGKGPTAKDGAMALRAKMMEE